jgi:drug/metabolite transporter (DMT)-like permease
MTTRTPASPALPDRSVLTYFAAFILLVGGAPVAMRISYAELQPFWMGLARFGLGAAAFWALALFKRIQVPRGRALVGALLYGALGVGISFVLMAWGLVKTSASMASILLAMVPLMTVLLSFSQGAETFTARGLFGALLALAGIGVTVGGASAADVSLVHVGAILLGTVFLAQSGVVIKLFPPTPPIMTNAVAMTVGAAILGAASLATGESWVIPSLPSTWAALSYLVIFVTVLAFMFHLQVLNKWSASGASYGFVIIPLVTVVVAAVLSNEPITANFLIGAVLVLGGVFVGALLPARKKPEVVEECKDCSGQVVSRCV